MTPPGRKPPAAVGPYRTVGTAILMSRSGLFSLETPGLFRGEYGQGGTARQEIHRQATAIGRGCGTHAGPEWLRRRLRFPSWIRKTEGDRRAS